MINGNLVQQVRLSSKHVAFVETDMPVMILYPEYGYEPILKLTELKDIIALRDMLNRAYPVEDKPCGTC